MSIWHVTPTLDQINHMRGDSMATHLGIVVTEVGPDYLRATMPVNERTTQPFGFLHGGASVALAETLASIGTHLSIDNTQQMALGMEINANHLRTVAAGGTVTATARPVYRGRTSQVWQIDLEDENGRAVCASRMTARVVDQRRG